MKRCPQCRRDYYDDTLLYCLDDGSPLLEGPASGEPTTAVISPPESVRTGTDTDKTKIYPEATSASQQIRSRGLVTGIAAVLGVIVLSAAGYGLYRFVSDSPAPQPQRSDAAIKVQRLTGDGKTRAAEISPDGKFLAYVRTEGGERSIWIKQIQTNSNIPIAKAGALDQFAGDLVFSPDGNFLYFNARAGSDEAPSIYRAPTLGGTPTRILNNAYGIQFSPDGRQVSFGRFDLATNESAVMIANADGTNERKIASRTGEQWFDGTAAWSPDGRMVAVVAGDDSQAPNPNNVVTLIPVGGGEITEPGSKWAMIDDLVWHPSGDSLIVVAIDSPMSQPQIWEVAYPSGAARRLTNNLNGHGGVSITSDGKSIVTGEIYARSAVWVSPDLKPENAKQVMQATGDTWGISWTPDNRIVYVSDLTGDAEIWIMDADGGNARPLTNDKAFKTTPVVSPDGRYIVYTSSTGGGQLCRIDINGGNLQVLATGSGADNPDISPDSKWVIFSTYMGGFQRIMRVPIDGGETQSMTDYHSTEPRYSRDGTRFACFVPNEKSQDWTRLAIVPAAGGPPIKVFDVPTDVNSGRGPIWTPDDKGISVVVAPGELQNLWLQPVDGGPGKMMTNFPVPGVARREYSRDGKRIAIVRAEGFGNAIMITDFR
jgi:Tol biopolymer transport system component